MSITDREKRIYEFSQQHSISLEKAEAVLYPPASTPLSEESIRKIAHLYFNSDYKRAYINLQKNPENMLPPYEEVTISKEELAELKKKSAAVDEFNNK